MTVEFPVWRVPWCQINDVLCLCLWLLLCIFYATFIAGRLERGALDMSVGLTLTIAILAAGALCAAKCASKCVAMRSHA